jgi:hypothetical protein
MFFGVVVVVVEAFLSLFFTAASFKIESLFLPFVSVKRMQ